MASIIIRKTFFGIHAGNINHNSNNDEECSGLLFSRNTHMTLSKKSNSLKIKTLGERNDCTAGQALEL